ncbi:MAG: hemolysin III family protein [Flavobacteriaceae bacterium]|nr:hemolysin III family protein [Flavobacteriaceae bacterium]|tara:strand:- start:932 stop:1552 length:621 start_codon:yes stop_codon:yes gene_type:complete
MPTEEKLNAWSHGLGVGLGIAALVLLLLGVDQTNPYGLFSVVVYGLSIILLFLASTCYHAIATTSNKNKHYFRVADHIGIYLLIAGTYTPVLLIAIPNGLGWPLFWVVWGIAAFGLLLKLFFTGKFERFSTFLYLAMGWLAIIPFGELTAALAPKGLAWLIAGGLAYTVGVVFYAIEKIPYNHFIWHLFVLGGASCHFFMVFLYVI